MRKKIFVQNGPQEMQHIHGEQMQHIAEQIFESAENIIIHGLNNDMRDTNGNFDLIVISCSVIEYDFKKNIAELKKYVSPQGKIALFSRDKHCLDRYYEEVAYATHIINVEEIADHKTALLKLLHNRKVSSPWKKRRQASRRKARKERILFTIEKRRNIILMLIALLVCATIVFYLFKIPLTD